MNQIVNEPLERGLFPLGINNVEKETSLPDGALRDSTNFDISNDGKMKTRRGYSKVYDGANIHSLSPDFITAGTYFVEEGELKELNGDFTATTLATVSKDVHRQMQYTQVGSKVFYANGIDTGCIEFSSRVDWGVPTPERVPQIRVIAGILREGTYHIVFTASRNGEESGASVMHTVGVSGGQGIELFDIPTLEGVDYLNMYMTKPNGTTLFKTEEIPSGNTSWTVSQSHSEELETAGMHNVNTGHALDLYNGRIYFAENSRLRWTEPFRYGLFHFDNYIDFPERITILGSVQNGLFVVSDKSYFLAGSDPEDFTMKISTRDRAIEGTSYKLSRNYFNGEEDYTGDGLYWTSTKGIVRGQNGGRIVPLTEKKVAGLTATSGAAGFIETDGIRKLVTALANTGGSTSLAASDIITATVTRNNGVTP